MTSARQAIILAAGRGSRMGELTADQPKCMTILAGRRLLDWQIAALGAAGITKLSVVAGYRKELLVSSEYALLENSNWAQTNMVATLRCAAAVMNAAATVVSYSDIVYHPDHVRKLVNTTADIAISYDVLWKNLWSARFENPLADAETFVQKDGWLTTIGERAKSLSAIEGQYMGLLKFTPTGWAQVEAYLSTLPADRQKLIDMTSLLRGLLAQGSKIQCMPVQGNWCEVDNQSDVQLYERQIHQQGQSASPWQHDWRW